MTDAGDWTETEAGGLMTFDMAERLFIWGFRVIAHSRRLGSSNRCDLRQVYEQFKVADAVSPLEAMLEVFACTAHAPIELHAVGCRCVSPSERGLLRAVGAVQHGCRELAQQRFEQWLPPLAADWIMTPAHGLGQSFANGGLFLPVRDLDAAKPQTTMAVRSWRVGSPILH